MDDDFFRCPVCSQTPHEPVLLNCLHSCCRSCVDSCTDEDSAHRVPCPKCREPMLCATGLQENPFVAAEIQALKMSCSTTNCSTCSDKGYAAEAAQMWCSDCCKALCGACTAEHRIHVVSHDILALQEALSSNKISAAIAMRCRPHGRVCDFICLQCRSLKCSTCIMACRDQQHGIEHRSCKLANELAAAITSSIQQELDELELKCGYFDSRQDVLKELLQSQKGHMETLQRNKKIVLCGVDRAYQAAEEFLKDKYALLSQRASELADAAGQLSVRARAAISYGHFVLRSQEIGNLLHHQQLLLSRLQSLVGQIEALPEADDITKCISIDSTLPEGLDNYCRAWIGIPRVAPGTLTESAGTMNDDNWRWVMTQPHLLNNAQEHGSNSDQAQAGPRSNSSGPSTLGFALDSFCPLTGGFHDGDNRSNGKDKDRTLTASSISVRDQIISKDRQSNTPNPFSRFHE